MSAATALDAFLDNPEDWLPSNCRLPLRTAILGHPPSVDRSFQHAIDRLRADPRFEIVRLFGPEHGIRGEAQDMESVGHAVDPLSGIPSVSLYGSTYASLTPSDADLDGIDLLVCDLQDVGARYYTFIASLLFCLREAGRRGIHTVVLDRPNPLAADIEGPSIELGFESFVGIVPVPIRHGMTPAEVVRYTLQFTGFFGTTRPSWSVVPVPDLQRHLWFEQTSQPWVYPSPNMPTVDTAWVYPGQCLIEGTNLSEGRGTTRPFELFGAPWLDPYKVLTTLKAAEVSLDGCILRPASFTPTFQKHARQRCSGFQIHVTDRARFRSVQLSTALLWAIRRTTPEFDWRTDAYEFVDTIPAIDLLFGSKNPRLAIDGGASWQEVASLLETPPELIEQIRQIRLPAYDAPP